MLDIKSHAGLSVGWMAYIKGISLLMNQKKYGGTVLNCFLIGPTLYGLAKIGAMGDIDIGLIPCLVFSAIIVAVDPVAVLAIFQEIGVNNVLYFLVFGESLFNDAVTVVLYNTMKEFNEMSKVTTDQVFLGLIAFFVVSLGGLCVGIIFGVLTAIITKYTLHVRVVEPLAVFVLAYISYLIAELFHFSGIISIIGCGLTQAQYAFHNISQKSHTTIKYFSKMQSSTSDCIIFLFLGIALFKPNLFHHENWHPGFILWTLLLCLIYRFSVVFILTYFVNKTNRMRRIGWEEQFIMAYGGLRGAVAFSLVNLLENGGLPKDMFTSATICLIFFTVFVQGISIKPLVKLLRVKLQVKDKLVIVSEEINMQVTDHIMAGIEEVIGERGENYFREILEHYNRKYLNFWLQREPMKIDEHIMCMFEKIALQQHFENLAGSKMIQEKYSSTEVLLPTQLLHKHVYEQEWDSDSSEGTVLPSVTVPATMPPPSPTFDLGAGEESIESLYKNVDARRDGRKKSMFSKRRESKHIENPTAKDIRKMLTPVRRDIPAKLDKNLKNESSGDLLKCLQEKQQRTRRMSRVVLQGQSNSGSMEIPNNIGKIPRKSFDGGALSKNYRKRLSLAVPKLNPTFVRERSPSDVTALRTMTNYKDREGDAGKSFEVSETQRKRPRKLKKANTLAGGELKEDESSPLVRHRLLDHPADSSLRGSDLRFDAIDENEEESFSSKSPSQRSPSETSVTGDTADANLGATSDPQTPSTKFTEDGVKTPPERQYFTQSSKLKKKRSLLQKSKSVDASNLPIDKLHDNTVGTEESLPNTQSITSPSVSLNVKSEQDVSSLRKSSYTHAISDTEISQSEHSTKGDNSMELHDMSGSEKKEEV